VIYTLPACRLNKVIYVRLVGQLNKVIYTLPACHLNKVIYVRLVGQLNKVIYTLPVCHLNKVIYVMSVLRLEKVINVLPVLSSKQGDGCDLQTWKGSSISIFVVSSRSVIPKVCCS
jgi:hypothetical protein